MNFLSSAARSRKRLIHHLLIILGSFGAMSFIYTVLFQFYPDSPSCFFRWSLATGYVAMMLLAMALTLGAWNFLRGRIYPVSSDLRRDTGIWCAIFSLAHVVFGLNVHLKSWTQYFIDDAGNLRDDAFGAANYLGAGATILVIVLLATSNDVSLNFFKNKRWKAIQRWNYVFVFFTVVHGFIYQYVEKRLVPFGFFFGGIALWILAIQITGFRKRRSERQSDKTAS